MGALKHSDWEAMLQELKWVEDDFKKVVRKLRPTWIRGKRLILVQGLYPVAPDAFAQVTTKGRKARLTVDANKYENSVRVLGDPDELLDLPDGDFTICQRDGKRVGLAYKRTGQDGRMVLSWIKLRDLRRFIDTAEKRVLEALSRYTTTEPYRGN
ncbi:MAG: hypothetical protein NTV52_00510 [Acidobacteria bacterium]|nr:hypothetical protein [Acidobacteriota bacterium]